MKVQRTFINLRLDLVLLINLDCLDMLNHPLFVLLHSLLLRLPYRLFLLGPLFLSRLQSPLLDRFLGCYRRDHCFFSHADLVFNDLGSFLGGRILTFVLQT